MKKLVLPLDSNVSPEHHSVQCWTEEFDQCFTICILEIQTYNNPILSFEQFHAVFSMNKVLFQKMYELEVSGLKNYCVQTVTELGEIFGQHGIVMSIGGSPHSNSVAYVTMEDITSAQAAIDDINAMVLTLHDGNQQVFVKKSPRRHWQLTRSRAV